MRRSLNSIYDWQLLRLIARGGNAPVPGRTLRLDRSRRTKDGTFLDRLVSLGLLERVTPGEAETTYPHRPAQFATTYRLTEQGLHAAEYGEYTVPEPRPLPVWDGSHPPVAPPVAAATARAKPAKRKRER